MKNDLKRFKLNIRMLLFRFIICPLFGHGNYKIIQTSSDEEIYCYDCQRFVKNDLLEL